MKTTPLSKSLPRRIAISVLLSLLAVACAKPGRFADYKKNNPLVVSKTTVSLTIKTLLDGSSMSDGPSISPEDASNLRGFINDYINRGRTAVTVEMNSDPSASSKIQSVTDLLIRAGLRHDEISIRNLGNGKLGGGMLILSFTANSVKVPECGKWSTNNDYNWSNRNSANYGCAYRHNLGLNIADPGDLKKAKPPSGYDTSRSDAVIYGYRAGGTPGTTGAATTPGSSSTGAATTGAFPTSGITAP